MARVAIVGAGIGGLCAARAVAAAGHTPVVLERAADDTAVGAGLVLWPNAVAALDRLGHGQAVRRDAVEAQRMRIQDQRGKAMGTVEVSRLAERAGAPMLVIERPVLHGLLRDGVAVRTGAEVTAVAGDAVTLAGGEPVACDAVIGADGINSIVRRHVAPRHESRDTPFSAIRGISSHQIDDAFELWGHREEVGAVSLGRDRTYWFYEAPAERIDAARPRAALTPGRFTPAFDALVAATDPDTLLVNRIRTIAPLATWVRETVAVLGDAAHAMAPNLGQGAAQAIEDAAALADALERERDLPKALTAYAEARRGRAARMQRESERAQRLILGLPPGPRNLLMRLTPDALALRMTAHQILA